jgi:hypothetical protein
MPNWKHKLDVSDVFHNESMTLQEIRDAIVRRIQNASWYKGDDWDEWLDEIVANLAEADDTRTFDSWWNELYDWADTGHRLWINTFAAPVRAS